MCLIPVLVSGILLFQTCNINQVDTADNDDHDQLDEGEPRLASLHERALLVHACAVPRGLSTPIEADLNGPNALPSGDFAP